MSEQNKNEITFITEPLTEEQLRKQMKETGQIEANILLTVEEIYDSGDEESFWELLDRKVTDGDFIISGGAYMLLGIHEKSIILNVVGHIETFHDEDDEDYEEDDDLPYNGREYNDGEDEFDFPNDDE